MISEKECKERCKKHRILGRKEKKDEIIEMIEGKVIGMNLAGSIFIEDLLEQIKQKGSDEK